MMTAVESTQTVPSNRILSSDDFCPRQCHYRLRRAEDALSPKEILQKSIEFGVTASDEDFATAASTYCLDLCTQRTIDTVETDLLGLAEHLSAFAEMVTWTVRTTGPWTRPDPKSLGNGLTWTTGAFLSQDERTMRNLVLVDRLDGMREMELRSAWSTLGECCVYKHPMDVLVVEIGQLRSGRWSNPFTTGWRHPFSRQLRFKKRDGESFGENWNKVWREHDEADRDDWLDAMQDDDVLAESLHVLHIDVPTFSEKVADLAEEKLYRIDSTVEAPEPRLGQCFDRIHPCEFRGYCPRWEEPE